MRERLLETEQNVVFHSGRFDREAVRMEHDNNEKKHIGPVLTFDLSNLTPELRAIYEEAVAPMSDEEKADLLELAFRLKDVEHRFMTDPNIKDPKELLEDERIKQLEVRLDRYDDSSTE